MRRLSNLTTVAAPEPVPEPDYPVSPGNYLELYGLSKAPFSETADDGGFIAFRSRQPGFDALVEHIRSGSGLMLIQGDEGSGKTTTLRAAAAIAAEAGQAAILVLRPPDRSIGLAELVSVLTGSPARDPDETITDRTIDHFLASPRKVLLADDIDLMPNECVRLLRSLAERIPDGPRGPALVLTSSTELSEVSNRPDLLSLVSLARNTVRLMPLKAAEVGQYIERSLWISGGTTRRLLSSDALKVLIARSDGMPGTINRLMEGALTAGFAKGDSVITAQTIGITSAPAPPRSRKRIDPPSGVAAVAIPVVAGALLVLGVSVFLYKAFDVEPESPKPVPTETHAAPSPPVVVPAPQPAPAVKPAEPMSADLMTALMKRGEQSLELGDIVAARLLFQRAAEAGNAAAAESLGKTYDPNYVLSGGKPDPARAADWYRKALGLGDTRAADMLRRLGNR